MTTIAAKVFNSTPREAGSLHVGFAPKRTPFDAASLAIVAVLVLLFAAAVICAMQPAHLLDPVQAALQGGL